MNVLVPPLFSDLKKNHIGWVVENECTPPQPRFTDDTPSLIFRLKKCRKSGRQWIYWYPTPFYWWCVLCSPLIFILKKHRKWGRKWIHWYPPHDLKPKICVDPLPQTFKFKNRILKSDGQQGTNFNKNNNQSWHQIIEYKKLSHVMSEKWQG